MAAVGSYRQAMRTFAGMTNLDVWYAHADMDELRAQFDSQLQARQRKMVDKGLAKARTRDSMQEVAKLTRMVDGRPRIISDPPLLVPIDELMPSGADNATFEAHTAAWSPSTSARWRPTAGTCLTSTSTATWPGRSSVSAVSGRAAGSS